MVKKQPTNSDLADKIDNLTTMVEGVSTRVSNIELWRAGVVQGKKDVEDYISNHPQLPTGNSISTKQLAAWITVILGIVATLVTYISKT